jgi:cation transport ATPase
VTPQTRAVARHLGIEAAIADVLPEDKAAEVKRLQSEGRMKTPPRWRRPR